MLLDPKRALLHHHLPNHDFPFVPKKNIPPLNFPSSTFTLSQRWHLQLWRTSPKVRLLEQLAAFPLARALQLLQTGALTLNSAATSPHSFIDLQLRCSNQVFDAGFQGGEGALLNPCFWWNCSQPKSIKDRRCKVEFQLLADRWPASLSSARVDLCVVRTAAVKHKSARLDRERGSKKYGGLWRWFPVIIYDQNSEWT